MTMIRVVDDVSDYFSGLCIANGIDVFQCDFKFYLFLLWHVKGTRNGCLV